MNPKKQAKQPSQLELAEQFIKTAMTGGITASAEIKALADSAGISKNTLDRAKSALGVSSVKQGDVWRWEMPAADEHPQEPQDSVYANDGVLGVLDSGEGGSAI